MIERIRKTLSPYLSRSWVLKRFGLSCLGALILSVALGVFLCFLKGIIWGLVVFAFSALFLYGVFSRPLFALHRLVWVGLTWLGVIIVTFGAIHLAPADIPESRGQTGFAPLTTEEMEAFKRSHGLHLPVFLNFSIQDRSHKVNRDLALLKNENNPEAERRLFKMSTLTFPELPSLLKRESNSRYQELFYKIIHNIDPSGAPKKADRYELLQWWKNNKGLFQPNKIQPAVESAVLGTKKSQNRVLVINMRAIPLLIDVLRNTKDSKKLQARDHLSKQAHTCKLLSRIAERSWHCNSTDPEKERLASISLWLEYYRQRELMFIDVEGLGKISGVFTRTRFYRWISRVFTLEFGVSRYFGRPVTLILSERLPVTLSLGLLALLFAYGVAVPLGVIAGSRPQSTKDRGISLLLMGLYCMPVFWLGMILLLALGGIQGPEIFPHSGISSTDPSSYPLGSQLLDRLWHMVLPVLCLSAGSIAILGRYGRDAMADTITENYIRTAWAKGLGPGRVYWVHGLRNASLPQIHLLGLQIPYLLSGSVIVERIFDIPGMGLLALTAIEMRDFNLLMGIISITAMLVLIGQLLADFLSSLLDPRTAVETVKGDPR